MQTLTRATAILLLLALPKHRRNNLTAEAPNENVIVILLLAVFHGLPAQGQTTTNGKATASGVCGVSAHSGNNDIINIKINNCGIGKEQGTKIIDLLSKILANNKGLAAMSAKLDELIAVASKPVQTQFCNGSNCVQGTNYAPMTYNQYGALKLEMTDAQRDSITDAMNKFPGVTVNVACENNTEDVPAFAEKLYQALHNAGMKINEPSCARMVGTFGPPHPGITWTVTPDHYDAANALANVLVKIGLLPLPANVERVPGTGLLTITVRANQ